MSFALKVFKKTSPNGKVTAYLGKRDFVDSISKIEPIDGVVVVDPEYVKGRKVYGQIVCTFRYGKEEDEIMGLSFQKELVMASQEITPNPKKEITKMQDRLMKKIGAGAMPFLFELSKNTPPSVTLCPAGDAPGKQCGVEYQLRIFVGENENDKAHKRSSIGMTVRIIQFAPTEVKNTRQPCTVVRRDFMLSPGELEMEISLEKQLFHHGETIDAHVNIKNCSNKSVKKIRAQVLQAIDVCLFDHGSYKAPVYTLETTEGCPIPPGGSLTRTFKMIPRLGTAKNERHGIALDGQMNSEDTDLASTTLMSNPDEKDQFGIIVTYLVKVRLFLGALSGELAGEVPIILMHPKPNPKKLPKMDSVAFETFRSDSMTEPTDGNE